MALHSRQRPVCCPLPGLMGPSSIRHGIGSTRHHSHTKRNALGGKGFGGNNFVAHGGFGGKIFAISLTRSFPLRFLFRATENPPASAAELDSDPDSLQLDQSPLHQQRSPLGLHHTHCTTIVASAPPRQLDLEGSEACAPALGFSPEKGKN